MSHAHSKPFICTCGWSGMFPLTTRTERRVDGLLEWKYIILCPDCGKPVKELR